MAELMSPCESRRRRVVCRNYGALICCPNVPDEVASKKRTLMETGRQRAKLDRKQKLDREVVESWRLFMIKYNYNNNNKTHQLCLSSEI